MSTQPNTTDLDRQRAEFEAWAEGYFMCFVLHRAGDGYAHTMTQAAWEAWQAATQQAAREQQEPFGYWIVEGDDLPYPGAGFVRALSEGRSYRSVTPLYAAPVAQQSEAGDDLHDLDVFKYMFEQAKQNMRGTVNMFRRDLFSKQSEAGAPTAAAEPVDFRERFKDAYLTLQTAHFNGPFWNQGMEELLAAVDAEITKRTSGRESAAPGAKQDAKDAALAEARELLVGAAEPGATQEKADIGMCAQWDVDALSLVEKIDVAMQKGAQ